MIISASRRTDIPACYAEWFMNRLNAGYAMMPNPRNPNRIGRVSLSPDIVDCIVFWTKNPAPMLPMLAQIEKMGYAFYFQFTLTPYGSDIEADLPPKAELESTFITLSRTIGAERVQWRYDPIIVDSTHTIHWHTAQFERLCQALHGATTRCIISFVDPYKSLGNAFRALTNSEIFLLAERFSGIAAAHGISLFTCAEAIDLSAYGLSHASCIDQGIIERIIGSSIIAKPDRNQRPGCGCIESVDIGAYDTCGNGCRYCYATDSRQRALAALEQHDPSAPMLTGYPQGHEIITDRTTASQRDAQIRFW